MPTYEYECDACGHNFDEFQYFSDDPLTVCPRCEGTLKKVFNSPGISFKGSGFYKNDSRSASSSSSSSSSGSSSSDSGSSSSSSSSSSDGGSSSSSSDSGSTKSSTSVSS